MLVGFIDRPKTPPLIAKVTAIMGQYYGIDIIYSTPEDINIHKNLISGKMYKNNKWISVKKKLPPLIDAGSRAFNRNTREITTYLRENTILTFDKKGTPSKARLQNELYKDNNFKHLVIPTENLDSFQTLVNFLEKHPSIILKPLTGQRGEGIYSISKQNDFYLLSYGKVEKKVNYNDVFEFYKKYLLDEKYILQKMIVSRTKNGDPFDCRIIVQKNGQAQWVIAKMLIRIGTGQKVISNTSHGGSISDPKPFLKDNFGSQWNGVYKKLNKLAVTLPSKIEEIKKTPSMDLGLDIGINESGDLFLFEANNGASVKRLTSESAILRLEYYQYLIDTTPVLNELNRKSKIVAQDNVLVQNEEFYKKKYNQMKTSKSWRLTSPIRYLGSFIKKNRDKDA